MITTAKRILLLALFMGALAAARGQVTLEQCVALARENYPLIRKYDLIARTQAVDLSDINRSWWPRIGVYGQGTAQNAVPALPDGLAAMLHGAGTAVDGMSRLQYKAGASLSQTVWDGGAAKARRELAEAQTAEQQSALEVQLYAVRERVENLYFSALLTDEQIRQTEVTMRLLQSNLDRLRAMERNGTALQADGDMVEARLLAANQQLVHARSAAENCRRLLGAFAGRDLSGAQLVRPTAERPAAVAPQRPELALLDARTGVCEAGRSGVKAGVMPRLGLFAQGYYGYPGFDNFKSMMNRRPSLNLMAGVKISWDIDALYTRRNSTHRLQLAADNVAAERETFLFNNRLEALSRNARIDELEAVMREDERIVRLRANVRQAAESQLKGGVIDAHTLLTAITDEEQARLTAVYHEIQFMQSIYELKYTLNR